MLSITNVKGLIAVSAPNSSGYYVSKINKNFAFRESTKLGGITIHFPAALGKKTHPLYSHTLSKHMVYIAKTRRELRAVIDELRKVV